MADLERTLKNINGTPAVAVLVVFWNDSLNEKATVRTTDKNGKFRIQDIDSVYPTGTYHLEYYGEGILPTIWDEAQTEKIQEDPVNPWEYNIQVINVPSVFDTTPPDDTIAEEIFMGDI
ncbi:MAG TPA: hypothetical protein ENN45_02670 [Bacteroidetes bacterium]|nr:hypothetical protein [Bacteroidota bacterium]